MTAAFAWYHCGQAAAISASVASGARCRAAIAQRLSPAATTTRPVGRGGGGGGRWPVRCGRRRCADRGRRAWRPPAPVRVHRRCGAWRVRSAGVAAPGRTGRRRCRSGVARALRRRGDHPAEVVGRRPRRRRRVGAGCGATAADAPVAAPSPTVAPTTRTSDRRTTAGAHRCTSRSPSRQLDPTSRTARQPSASERGRREPAGDERPDPQTADLDERVDRRTRTSGDQRSARTAEPERRAPHRRARRPGGRARWWPTGAAGGREPCCRAPRRCVDHHG